MATKKKNIRKATSHRNAIQKKLTEFVKRWKDESKEEAEAKSFWDDFFRCFGIDRKEVAAFEYSVERSDNSKGFIDLFWKGVLLVEHKSRGRSLDKAQSQAFDYVQNIKRQADIPRYVLLSDFASFKLYELESKAVYDIKIEDLVDNLHLFDFMSGLDDHGKNIEVKELNIKAAERLGKLHDALDETNYSGHDLEVFLVRVLFCFFAEDTGIFARHQFYNFILNFTNEDGSDTEVWLHKLFQVLDKPDEKRNKNLQAELHDFPYVNGHLFRERLDLPSFDEEMREALLDCALVDWSSISPAIFGSLFQSVMDKGERRELGAHYTSETNILRLIEPLFLDDLRSEFSAIQKTKQVKNKQKKLSEFQQKLTGLQFFDPACGCGNFLIITYRELRRLELAVLREQHGDSINQALEITIEPTIKLEHFHGIEIEEFPARIAEVAMWLTQHQMNREFAKQFGVEPELLPLKTAAHIVNGNALQVDWEDVVKPNDLNYIIGNPPFVGKSMRTKEQNSDMDNVFSKEKGYKLLDYVTCWFHKSQYFMDKYSGIKTALVSTNSIAQGEQAALLWETILSNGFVLNFAHQTFCWESEARGKAAVHVVIVGFSRQESNRRIFIYSDLKAEPVLRRVDNINPYLMGGSNAFMKSKTNPLQKNIPSMVFGNMPNDGGNLLLTTEEKDDLISRYSKSKKWIKPCLGATEFINSKERWCLWLEGIKPDELRSMPDVIKRVQATQDYRNESKRKATQKLADMPTLFGEIRQKSGGYILVPSVSSERREYIPMGFFDKDTISTNLNLMVPNATMYHFGVLESEIHMDWMRTVCGRMKSDYRYSAKLVYNNFPWPEPTPAQKTKVEKLAQKVLDVREKYPDSSLADLYDSLAMPGDLRKAHKALDKAVEQCYRKEKFKNEMERLSFLFERYSELTKESC